jgi:hypothetical protein
MSAVSSSSFCLEGAPQYFEMGASRFEKLPTQLLPSPHLKRWNRKWKLRLIEELNPHWEDLLLTWSA